MAESFDWWKGFNDAAAGRNYRNESPLLTSKYEYQRGYLWACEASGINPANSALPRNEPEGDE